MAPLFGHLGRTRFQCAYSLRVSHIEGTLPGQEKLPGGSSEAYFKCTCNATSYNSEMLLSANLVVLTPTWELRTPPVGVFALES